MAAGAAGDGLLRRVFEGCISGHDMGIGRRPYHRNCSCALHKSSGHCSHTSPYTNVCYPLRRAWSENCLSLMAPVHCSPCSSPAGASGETGRTHLVLCLSNEEEIDSSNV
ncbi:unnamed protein product [Ilex paraguariensis]|uniref:Uncharacterized protein n=1 Tax=Ilex paraguariensis TaxID=185542 RepID=A0ABC8SKK8_9AQUA